MEQRHGSAEISPTLVEGWTKALAPMRRYHRHDVVGLENIPKTGPALLVFHHSLATYDGFMFAMAAYEHTGRLPNALGDDLIFKTPLLAELAWKSGIRPASPKAGYQLLKEGRLLYVSPGGMWESLRPTDEARQVRWNGRMGFCRLALRAQVPLIMIACPSADDIYTVQKSRLTDMMYKHFRLPMPRAKGRRGTPIPRPIQLTHYVSEPLIPPLHDPANEDDQIASLHGDAVKVMQSLLGRDSY